MVGLFLVSSVWVAIASLYPMAFDEEFHFGLIKIYAAHWLPYGIENTRDMAQYGAAASDPSYLFHYLMSFPYRLLDWMGLSQTAIIVWLRLLNVAMVVGSLFIYKKALLTAKASKAITHGVIAAFTLIPIVPMMAGQMNYDNLLLIMVALSFWFIIQITNRVRATGFLPVGNTLTLVGVILISLPVKYAYVPIALVLCLWLLALVVVSVKQHGKIGVLKHARRGFNKITLNGKIWLVILALAGIFFSARYVENYVRYETPIPSCHVIFDEDACMDFGPWARDFLYKKHLDPQFSPKSFPAYFSQDWVPGMIYRLTFTLAGKTNDFQTKQPLPLVWPLGCVFLLVGLLAFIRYFRVLIKKYPYTFLTLLVTLTYIGMLSIKLYLGYRQTGVPAAINGRYILPLVPFIMATLVHAILYGARRLNATNITIIVLTLALAIIFLQGGGVFTYIVLGESHWFYTGWGQASHAFIKAVLSPITWQHRWFG